MHLYPADFAGLKDVTLDVPYTERDTWFDSAISIEDAAALGRLDDVPRLWVIDRVDPGVPGARERQDLTALGFEWVREIDAHRSVVDEYVRVP
jgi:mannosyltransferase